MNDGVTLASLRAFFAQPEWRTVLSHLEEIRKDAVEALCAADAANTAVIARHQATIRTLDYLLDGTAVQEILAEQKENKND